MTNLDSSLDLDLCEFYSTCNPDDEDTENYCVCGNYENCTKYREIIYKSRKKDLDGRCGE